jgi:hypothetical protein
MPYHGESTRAITLSAWQRWSEDPVDHVSIDPVPA